jgi:hypothetical protein
MSLIYEPKGKAREYSPLALNPYSGGCDHGCTYCYCANIMRGAWGTTPRARSLAGLEREAKGASRQVLLSFISDPYCRAEETHRNTRHALNVLRDARCSVAILTKGGTRCLSDLDMFKSWPDGRIKVGATLTFAQGSKASEFEPGAAHPADRVEALRQLHDNGVKTWASIEPVIEADESLAIIWASLPYVDGYKVGKLNHSASVVDWASFGVAAVNMIREAGRRVYVKVDLRPFLPVGFLRPEEIADDSLTLPDRPTERTLI